MSATRSTHISFPGDNAINQVQIAKLLCKRSYVDSEANVLMLLQGKKIPPSAVHIPTKYSKVLHIISYRYDVYKHTALIIQGYDTNSNIKPALQQLARVLQYLDDIRSAYVARARRSSVYEDGWFCPEVDYHLWLDYTEKSYHSSACTSMEKQLAVTFDYVLERCQPDIFNFIDWDEYVQRHSGRFDMCGLGVTLGKHEPPVPQAAHDFAKAILDDLEIVDRKRKGKVKVADAEDLEVEEKIKKGTSRVAGKKNEKKKKLVWRGKGTAAKQPQVEDHEHETESEGERDMAEKENQKFAENSQDMQDHYTSPHKEDTGMTSDLSNEGSINNDDGIMLMAINAEEKQDRYSPKRKHRMARHGTSPGKSVGNTAYNIWNARFSKLHNFCRNRLTEIYNVDINEIHDATHLDLWHSSIDSHNPNAMEILGHITILGSIIRLEQGDTTHLCEALTSLGTQHRLGMHRRVHEKIDEQEVQNGVMVSSCVVPGETYSRMDAEGEELEGEGEGEMEMMADDRENVLGEKEKANEIWDFFAEIGEDLGLELEIDPIAQDRSTSEDDGTRTSTDAALKRKRAASMRSTLPEHGRTSTKKTKHPSLQAPITQNPLASITAVSTLECMDNMGTSPGITFQHRATTSLAALQGPPTPSTSSNPMDTLNTVEDLAGSDNDTSAVDDSNKGHEDEDETTPRQKRNRGRPRKVPRGQRKVKAESSKRSPKSPEKIYGKVVVHENPNRQTCVTGPAENNNNASEVTMPPPQIWIKAAAVYMNEAMKRGNLMLTQDVCAVLFSGSYLARHVQLSRVQEWYQSAALQDDLITLVQALFAIEADFGLVSDWMAALNKLSDLRTMIHEAQRESEAKPEELGRLEVHILGVIEEQQRNEVHETLDARLRVLQHVPYLDARNSVLIHLAKLMERKKLEPRQLRSFKRWATLTMTDKK
ncbi:hypothetical protein HD554DRAFT_2179397 [Boletus coccyginus]|nr:hypothetical protein HD554DRAFT_2179397 [Boletus coccyginus]